MRKFTFPVLIFITLIGFGGYGLYKYVNQNSEEEKFESDLKKADEFVIEASEHLKANRYHQAKALLTLAINRLKKYDNNKKGKKHKFTCGELLAFLHFYHAEIECKLHQNYKLDKNQREKALKDLEWIDKNGYMEFLISYNLKFWTSANMVLTLKKEKKFLLLVIKYRKHILYRK